jgi:hypothetical protein
MSAREYFFYENGVKFERSDRALETNTIHGYRLLSSCCIVQILLALVHREIIFNI